MSFRNFFARILFAWVVALSSAQAAPFEPLSDLKVSAANLIDRESQIILASSTVSFFAARSLDSEAQSYMSHKRRIGDFEFLGNEVLGTGVPGALLALGFWLTGEVKSLPRVSGAGQAQAEALIATGLLTAATKAATNRERPDSSDHYSFPSGHTSTVFATATVFQDYYGWKAGVPFYLLGALTAASRVSANRHWFSDTVGGAALGLWIGHAIARAHLQRESVKPGSSESRLSKVSFYPVLEPGGAQLVLRLAL